ncbi:hypothetical protein AYK25_01640 [Thermoplasmatales archaeon SM1-50]|nr:MAG: hypothetical protein AYK25_01640 [Thermoplasmatales archaeon SM1-50]
MKKEILQRSIALGIIILLIGGGVIPSLGDTITEKNKIKPRINENNKYVSCTRNELDDGRNGWNHTFGGNSYDEGYSVQQTNDNGYIITGATLSFGAGNWDVWLIKIDTTGSEEWNRTFGGSNYDRGSSVQQTNDGGYVILGATYSYGQGDFDVWLIKTDSVGNEEWNFTFGGSSSDWGCSVQQTKDYGYILTGYTDSYGAGNSDVWLIKTDSAGNEIWNSTFGGIQYDRGFSVQQTTDSGYILTGYTVSYDADGTGCDIWLIKTDVNGIEEWHQTFGGTGISNKFDMAYSVQQTNDGGYIIIGDTEIYFVAESDIWLIKTDANGNEEWNRIFGGVTADRGRSVQQTNDMGYIITGWTTYHRGADPDLWLIKTNSSGNEEWQYTYRYGENSSDWGYSVQQTNDAGYIIVGATMPDGWNNTDSSQSYRQEGTDVWLIKTASENHPPIKPIINGPAFGRVGVRYNFTIVTTDPDGNECYYLLDWGDETQSSWLGPYQSGVPIQISHTWNEPGTYLIKGKTKDINGAESDWSSEFLITIVQLKTAFFLGTFTNISQTDDLMIMYMRFFIVFPSDSIFHQGGMIVIWKEYLGYIGQAFCLGRGNVVVL